MTRTNIISCRSQRSSTCGSLAVNAGHRILGTFHPHAAKTCSFIRTLHFVVTASGGGSGEDTKQAGAPATPNLKLLQALDKAQGVKVQKEVDVMYTKRMIIAALSGGTVAELLDPNIDVPFKFNKFSLERAMAFGEKVLRNGYLLKFTMDAVMFWGKAFRNFDSEFVENIKGLSKAEISAIKLALRQR